MGIRVRTSKSEISCNTSMISLAASRFCWSSSAVGISKHRSSGGGVVEFDMGRGVMRIGLVYLFQIR